MRNLELKRKRRLQKWQYLGILRNIKEGFVFLKVPVNYAERKSSHSKIIRSIAYIRLGLRDQLIGEFA